MKKLLLALFLFLSFAANVKAEDTVADPAGKLPRMASIRSNNVNARSGPGGRYPIEWTYMQRGAPVEVIAEFELWRQIRDWDGSQSWVHKSMLSGHRTIKVTSTGQNNIYSQPNPSSKIIAKVEDEVIGEVKECPAGKNFCKVKFDGAEGWISRNDIFGVYPDEVIN